MCSFPVPRSLGKSVKMADLGHALENHSSQEKFAPNSVSRTNVVLSDAPSMSEMVACTTSD